MLEFVLYVYRYSWGLFDLTKGCGAASDVKDRRRVFEYSAIFVGARVDENIITGLHLVECAAQFMNRDILACVIIGNVSFAMDVERAWCIESLLKRLHGFLIARQPVVCFILAKDSAESSDI